MAFAVWLGSPGEAGAEQPSPPSIDARAWLLIDPSDGATLAAHGATGSAAMASTTKLMTAYLALRRLPLARTIVVPAYHAMPGESLMGLRAGDHVSVRNLLYGLLLPSGNDAAVALADGVAGSTDAFVREMNRAASRLGLDDTSYANPIGLDEAGNYSSPRDLARLTVVLRRNRVFRRIVDTPRKTLAGAHPPVVVNRNDLVAKVPWVNGVKTGYTAEAGNVLIASGTMKGVTLISVVMGAPSEAARDADDLNLLRYGFSLYRRETPVRKGQRLAVRHVPNADGRLPLLAGDSVGATLRRGQAADLAVDVPPTLAAPIRRGERLGTVTVTVEGTKLGTAPLVAARRVVVASEESLVARVDAAVPGPRAALWAIVAAVAAIVIGIAVALARRRG